MLRRFLVLLQYLMCVHDSVTANGMLSPGNISVVIWMNDFKCLATVYSIVLPLNPESRPELNAIFHPTIFVNERWLRYANMSMDRRRLLDDSIAASYTNTQNEKHLDIFFYVFHKMSATTFMAWNMSTHWMAHGLLGNVSLNVLICSLWCVLCLLSMRTKHQTHNLCWRNGSSGGDSNESSKQHQQISYTSTEED